MDNQIPITSPFVRAGTSGLPQYGGYVLDEWMRELQGIQGQKIFREMADNDSVIGAILYSVEMLIRQVEWQIAPGASQQDADFVDDCLHSMDVSWEDTISDILSMFIYGWSLHELMYCPRSDGRIGWKGWPVRGQETLQRWIFDDVTEDLLAMVQLGPPDYAEHIIPLGKALLFRTTLRRNNPQGRSILRNCFRDWYFKKRIETIEAIGVERDMAGLPIIRVPAEILNAEPGSPDYAIREEYIKIATSIKRDEQEGIVLSSGRDDLGNLEYDIQLLSAPGNRQFSTDAIIARKDQRLTMAVMADFLTLGHERVGSNALAQEKGRLFTAALNGWTTIISTQVNKYAIPRLLRLNGLPTDDPPRLVHGRVERPDILMLGTFILNLQEAGAQIDLSPGTALRNALLEAANLPVEAMSGSPDDQTADDIDQT